MATTAEVNDLLADAKCLFCLAPGQVMYAILAVIDAINQGDPVPSTPSELMQAARCFECALSPGMVPYAILAALIQLGGGGSGGGGGVTCGSGPPVAAPAAGCGLYIDTDDGTLWEFFSGSWH